MADLLETANTWLADKLKQHCGKSVTYKRGATTITVTAVRGRTELELTESSGSVSVLATERDYLIQAADISSLGEPERGDQVREVAGASTAVFEAASPVPGMPVWRWADPYHKTYRVHTKRVATE